MIVLPNRVKHRQQSANGLATLLFCMILLASATTLIFTMTRTSLAEQRIMGNEYRIETLRQACEAGLDYGHIWLRLNEPIWQTESNGQHTFSLPLSADNLGLSDTIHIQINYLSSDINSPFIQIHAQASQNNDRHYHMRQFIHYTVINSHANETGFMAQVITVPGTWHDYE